MTNQHGDDFQGALTANFSANVWHAANNAALYKHLSGLLPSTCRYPEIEAESLITILAKTHSLNPSQLSIGNGSIEIIYRIAQTYRGSKSLIVSPTFSEYSKACTINEHEIKRCRREKLMNDIADFKPDLVWVCNPNNPDGYCFNLDELRALFYKYPHVMFIIDQSFVYFTLQPTPVASSILEFPNLVFIYSLTKRYNIAGLRLGYVISSQSIKLQLDRYKIPWSVNTLAIEAGKYILHQKDNSFNLKAWLVETVRFQNEINKIGIFKSLPTQTPFFLVILRNGKANDLKAFLLKSGILIRDASDFENNTIEMIRLNTLSVYENNLLINKLIEWKHNLSL